MQPRGGDAAELTLFRCPVFEAFRNLHVDISRDLVNSGACLDDPDILGHTVLNELIFSQHDKLVLSQHGSRSLAKTLELVDFLSAQEFSDFESKNRISLQSTPLQMTITFNYTQLHFKIRSVMCWRPTEEGIQQIFAAAAYHGCVPVLEDIWSKFPDPDLRGGKISASGCGLPVLSALLGWNHPSVYRMIEILLDRGVDLTVPSADGRVALHYAAQYCQSVRILEGLIECGTDIEATNKMGDTPMHLAAMFDNAEAIRALHQHGANVNVRSPTGCTPLHIAVAADCGDWDGARSTRLQKERTHAIEVLLELGADPHLTCLTPPAKIWGKSWRAPRWCKSRRAPRLSRSLGVADMRLRESWKSMYYESTWYIRRYHLVLTPGEWASHVDDLGDLMKIHKTALYRHMERLGRAGEVYIDAEGDVFWERSLVAAESEDALACTSSWDFKSYRDVFDV